VRSGVGRATGALAIVGAVVWFLSTVLPSFRTPSGQEYQVLTAFGDQPFRHVAAMAIWHWTPIVVVAVAGAWLLTADRMPSLPAGILLGIGVWTLAQAVASLVGSEDRLIGAWLRLGSEIMIATAGVLAALASRGRSSDAAAPQAPPPPV
jgi:hypothetical protein